MIEQLSLPAAAAIDYAGGDVRHFAPGDGMATASIATPTRQLAHRDNLIAEKLMEVVSAVNNREQYVNLPTMRTVLPATGSQSMTNFRIPPGFEARVFNAAVSTTPPGYGKLEIFHSDTFGSDSGSSIVTTMSEFPGATDAPVGTDFRPTGELIVKLTNVGTATAEIVASVILTMRPIGENASLIGAGSVAAKGSKGDRGPVGLVWKGNWVNGTAYAVNDGVYSSTSGTSYICILPTSSVNPDNDLTFTYWNILAKAGAGTPVSGNDGKSGIRWAGPWELGVVYHDNNSNTTPDINGRVWGADAVGLNSSSYICKLSHTSIADNAPGAVDGDTYWDVLSLKGADGNAAERVAYKGAWSSQAYTKGDVVTYSDGVGLPKRTYVANSNVTTDLSTPPSLSAKWDELFGPSPTPGEVFKSDTSVAAGISAGAGYTKGVTDAPYYAVDLSSPVALVFHEVKLDLQSGNQFGTMMAQGKMIFTGTARFTLPSPAQGILGASNPWTSTNTTLTATIHGEALVETDRCKLITVTSGTNSGTTYFDITVLSTVPQKVSLDIFGSEVTA